MNTDDESRSLIISNFRNLGISSKNTGSENAVLKINRSLDRDHLGGLVTILGFNNCGKTNVLDALSKVNNNTFEDSDKCDFEKYATNPSVSFDVAHGKYGNLEQPRITHKVQRLTLEGPFKNILLYILKQKESYLSYCDFVKNTGNEPNDEESYMNGCLSFVSGKDYSEGTAECIAHILSDREDIQYRELHEFITRIHNGEFHSIKDNNVIVSVKGTPLDDLVLVGEGMGPLGKPLGVEPKYIKKDRVEEYKSNQKGIKSIGKMIADAIKIDPNSIENVKQTDFTGGIKDTEVVPDSFSDKYGYNLGRNVYRYNRMFIKGTDFKTETSHPNEFISNLFTILGYDPQFILDKKYLENTETRKRLEKELNNELELASEEFNMLISTKERKYNMDIRLEKDEISFTLSLDDGLVLNIEHQSEGFRWMFEFFINFLKSNKFVAGDIILIDEFGGLLNYDTVNKLTGYMREFGKKNGITFVIATQNPMAVDINHLEEIRLVVSKDNKTSTILNDFTEFETGGEGISIKPVLSCLTVNHHFLKTDETYTVFVGNVRDYFLLSGFSRKLNKTLDVIPISNLDNLDDATVKYMRNIESIPLLLVESNAQDIIKQLEDKGIKHVSVDEILEDKPNLYELLSEEDRAGLETEGTSFDATYSATQRIIENPSEMTLKNFEELIDYLCI